LNKHTGSSTPRKYWSKKRENIAGLSVLEETNGSATWLHTGTTLNDTGSFSRPKTSIHGPESTQVIELGEVKTSGDQIHIEKNVTWVENKQQLFS